MVATAKLKYLRFSAQKTRLVIDQVRGMPVGEALDVLRYSQKMVSRPVEKLVRSAVANAQNKDASVDVDELIISRAVVEEAPTMKRIRHRAMGRVFQIFKRSCHITVDLDVYGKS